VAKKSGLKIDRKYTTPGNPYNNITWEKRSSKITNPDGSVVFEMNDVEIPSTWSQVATDIMVSKYFRKAGVPQLDADGNELKDENGDTVLGPESSSRQVFDRLAETWRHWGETTGYFASSDDAQAFEDELKYMLATQMAAPNSPQWFNTGLNYKYDLTGPAQGFWYVDPKTGKLTEVKIHTQDHNHMLVLFNLLMMIWSMRVELWTSGSKKHVCSSLDQVLEQTSLT